MRWSIGPFGIKDLFSLVNLLGGVFAIHFVVAGDPTLAGYALLAGFMLGDTLDGPIARLTNTSNRFGSEFDTAIDHFGQAIAPAIIVYAVYARGGHAVTGIVLMAIVITCATVRQALFTVAKMGDPLMSTACAHRERLWLDGVRAVALLLFATDTLSFVLGAALNPLFALLNLRRSPTWATGARAACRRM